MAGDWIKMRADLLDDPTVFRLADLMGADELTAVGALFCFWSWADRHSVDGRVDGATSRLVDRVSHKDGFCAAMISVGWLVVDDSGLTIPNFDRHNGESAKERSLKNQRQARWRERKANGLVDEDASTEPSTNASTREEKRREEKEKEHSSSGDDPRVQSLETRLSEVTLDAVETWNESALVAGGLAKVRTSVGMDKRRQQVRRMLTVAREICRERFGESRIPRKFWVGLWDQYAGDEFFSGRSAGGKGHENWRPDFKYLTHPETVVKLYDKVCAGEATA